MSEQEHTPGPWQVGCRLDARVFDAEAANILLITGPRWDVAYAAHLATDGNSAEQEANAKLIAAAPDLLALLQELVDIEGPQPGHVTWANKVKAAIAKATE